MNNCRSVREIVVIKNKHCGFDFILRYSIRWEEKCITYIVWKFLYRPGEELIKYLTGL